MGERGEIFSTRLYTDEGKKTFFFNVKENRFGDRYLNIVESRKTDFGGFRRSSIIVFEEHISDFSSTLERFLVSPGSRRGPSSAELVFDEGRRTYTLSLEHRRRKELVISEVRIDENEEHRQKIFVPEHVFTIFLKEYEKALSKVLQ